MLCGSQIFVNNRRFWVFKILRNQRTSGSGFLGFFFRIRHLTSTSSFFNVFRIGIFLRGPDFSKNLKVPLPALVKQPTKNWWFRLGSLTQFLNIYKTLDIIRVRIGSLIFGKLLIKGENRFFDFW
jgi:hypothetical protein